LFYIYPVFGGRVSVWDAGFRGRRLICVGFDLLWDSQCVCLEGERVETGAEEQTTGIFIRPGGVFEARPTHIGIRMMSMHRIPRELIMFIACQRRRFLFGH
jgi:hypothetical protein